ncbi:hypothetical protein FVEN_g2925 [Fusarium venenatum]|uniref:Uncharacterized protein n=2 Tax=Fusarium venenatum TaxID=56646 RepID=A0A2L2SYI0_9HYPO|nr:uncharacterized protein FVRRES_06305 [Fusarium venenatum]KAG8359259.1 hypothetical protein FVEN_g2925 [Fusarium venenatum]CEI61869.1 unnamed protein product [Fusarium venenatum]
MKASIILSTSVFASTAVARLYKRDEIVARADMSSSTSAAPIAASPTGTGDDGAEETLSTDTGAPSTAGTTTSSISARPSIPDTYDCVSECNSNYDTCRTAPGANMSTCAAQYAGCLGYNPFEGGSLVTPTACSAPASDTPKPTQPGTSDCVTGCNNDYNKCRTAPGANMSTCAAQYAGCLGYNPFEGGSLVTPTACSEEPQPTQSNTNECVDKCNSDYDKCRTAPDANMSTCAAQYSQCLGYNPFDGAGSLVTPTACSNTPGPTLTSTSAVQSSMTSPSPPPQQDTTMQGTETYQPPVATCTSNVCTQPTMTDHEAPPVMTESPVVVDGAGSLRPWMTLIALAALAIL